MGGTVYSVSMLMPTLTIDSLTDHSLFKAFYSCISNKRGNSHVLMDVEVSGLHATVYGG